MLQVLIGAIILLLLSTLIPTNSKIKAKKHLYKTRCKKVDKKHVVKSFIVR